jgi:putative flippase GtrA
MYQKLLARLHTPFGRYLVVGGTLYVFELIIIVIAQKAGANAIVAVGISYWSGLIASFLLTKFITFRDRRTHHRIVLGQFVAMALLVLFNFCFTILVTKLLQNIVPPYVSRTIALAVTVIWNFYLYKTRIFKTDAPLID